MFTVKYRSKVVGLTHLEKGDPPMGVALGMLDPICPVEHALGKPLNSKNGIKGWEVGLEVFLSDGQRLECQSTYLEQFDLGKGELIYQISCHRIHWSLYQAVFPHHVIAYENSFT